MTSKVVRQGLPKMVRNTMIGSNVMRAQQGFTFIGLMVIITVSGILLAATGVVWQQAVKRDKEQDLLYYGDQYRRAITQYYERSPSGIKQFPSSLEALVLDKRFPKPERHLRRLYANPITQDGEWQVIKVGGQIRGVATDSDVEPLKVSGFPDIYASFEKAQSYADWQFVYIEPQPQSKTFK